MWAVGRRFWWGRYSLRRSFWLFFVAGWPIAIIISLIAAIPLAVAGARPAPIVFGAASLHLYPLWAAIGVWRSADAYPYARWWPWMAKAFILFVAAFHVWWLAGGGLQRWIELAS